MNCDEYRNLFPKYSKPLSLEALDTPEYEQYRDHWDDCQTCGDWTAAQRVQARGGNVEDYPCVHIAYRVTEKLVSTCDDPFEDPDVVIWKFDSTGVYGIPIRNGGSAIIVIEYCPWCGIRLPKQ